jgi:hypothetical protein
VVGLLMGARVNVEGVMAEQNKKEGLHSGRFRFPEAMPLR